MNREVQARKHIKFMNRGAFLIGEGGYQSVCAFPCENNREIVSNVRNAAQ